MTVNKLDEFDRRKQLLPEYREFKTKWANTPRRNAKVFLEYKKDLRRMTKACTLLANEIYGENK